MTGALLLTPRMHEVVQPLHALAAPTSALATPRCPKKEPAHAIAPCPCARTPVLEKVKKNIKKIVEQVWDGRRQRNWQTRLRLNINCRNLFEARNCRRGGVLSLFSFFKFIYHVTYCVQALSAVTIRTTDQAASLSSVLQPGTRSLPTAVQDFSLPHSCFRSRLKTELFIRAYIWRYLTSARSW